MATRKITVAVAGEADVELDKIKELLNDFLGYGEEDEDGFPEPTAADVEIFLPGTPEYLTEGVKTVTEWIDYAGAPYILVTDDVEDRKVKRLVRNALDVVITKNVAAELIDQLAKASGEKYLLLLWQDGDTFAETLLDLATAEQIPVKDLTEGLDDISFEDEPGPDEDDEPAAAPTAEVPLNDEEAPLEDNDGAKDGATKSVPVKSAPAAPTESPSVVAVLEQVYEYLYLQDRANAARNLAVPFSTPLTELVGVTLNSLRPVPVDAATSEVEQHGEEEAVVESDPVDDVAGVAADADDTTELDERPRRGRRGSRRAASGGDDDAVAYLRNSAGEYRKRGRGRPKRDEETVYLTPDKLAELGLDG